jgi:TPR repeat protein
MEIPPTAEESSNYDAGIAAYKRGHYDVAIYDFEQRAVQGDPIAQFCLAFMYKHGKGVPQNFQNAIEWYIKSAEQGYVPAQNDLGIIYSRIVEKKEFSYEEIEKEGLESVIMSYSMKSVESFTEAANRNNAIAQFNLALVDILVASQYPEGSEGYLECLNKHYFGIKRLRNKIMIPRKVNSPAYTF